MIIGSEDYGRILSSFCLTAHEDTRKSLLRSTSYYGKSGNVQRNILGAVNFAQGMAVPVLNFNMWNTVLSRAYSNYTILFWIPLT